MKHVQSWSVVGALAACSILSLPASARPFAQKKGGDEKPGAASTAKPAAKAGPCLCLSSDVIGIDVVSTTGESLGDIDDVVLRPNGEIAYAVLSFGGVLGVGDKLFAVPWNVLQPKSHAAKGDANDVKHEIVLPIEKERLKNAPGFDKAHWPQFADANWSKDVDAFYGGARRDDTSRPVEAGTGTRNVLWRCSQLNGFDLETPSGEKLGDIRDVALDTNGRVSYAVLSVGGFLGVGDRLVAVPWEALRPVKNGEKYRLTLAATKERLAQAPQYDAAKDKRAQMCDPQWVGRVYEFYSVRPYWITSNM